MGTKLAEKLVPGDVVAFTGGGGLQRVVSLGPCRNNPAFLQVYFEPVAGNEVLVGLCFVRIGERVFLGEKELEVA